MRLKSLLYRLPRSLRAALGTNSPPPAFIRVAYTTPRNVVLVTSRYAGAQNVWPMDWHTPLSIEPQLYGISITHGSYGAELVAKSGCFVVNFVPASWEQRILYCGSTSGRDEDKFKGARLQTQQARSIDAPVLEGGYGWLECRVERVIGAGDHDLVVGRVTHAAITERGPELHHIDGGLGSSAGSFE